MSNYIHVLKRLENDRRAPSEARPAAAAPAIVASPAPAPVASPVPESAAAPSAPVAPAHPAVALRAMPSTPARVVAGAPALERERAAEPTAGAAHAPAAHRNVDWAPPPIRPLDPRRLLSDEALKGIAALLDNIRVLAAGQGTRTVVFAGASKSEPVGLVTAGLAAHAERQGMTVFAADLTKTDGRSFVAARRSRGDGKADAKDALEIDLDGGAAPSDLTAWLERVAPDAQLVIVAGPPLAHSIDTALLACASDGLVIVAESEVTDRNALQLAAERARIAGCRTLGVVMHGTQERMPAWMRRLMGSPTNNDAPRED